MKHFFVAALLFTWLGCSNSTSNSTFDATSSSTYKYQAFQYTVVPGLQEDRHADWTDCTYFEVAFDLTNRTIKTYGTHRPSSFDNRFDYTLVEPHDDKAGNHHFVYTAVNEQGVSVFLKMEIFAHPTSAYVAILYLVYPTYYIAYRLKNA
jgi:hypothetical protein